MIADMADKPEPDGIVLTEAQRRSRRQRSIAIAWALGYFDAIYGIVSLILGAGMLVLAINVYMRRERAASLRATRKLFAFSILYLFVLFATLLAEVVFRALAPMVGGA